MPTNISGRAYRGPARFSFAHGMPAQLNVLHVSSARVYGGNEEHVRILVKHLAPDRFRVAVALPQGGEFASVLRSESVQTEGLDIDPRRLWRSAKGLARICRERQTHIVHSHNRREDLVAAWAGRMANVPVRVSTIHDRINMSQEGERVRGLSCKVYNWILRHGFDALLAVSRATRDDVIAEAGVDPDKAIHVVNGMDLDRLAQVGDPLAKRAELGIGPGELVCGMVARVRGRRIGKKGHQYLLAAIPEVVRQVPHARFVIAGADDEAAAYLLDLACGLGVERWVHLLGYRKDVLDVMQVFDVVVLPSLFEGLPRTLMEAMALGKPAVGTNVDGIAELVVPEECGLLVPPRDADALARALIRVLSDGHLRAHMGQAARERIAAHFDGRSMATGTAAVYERLAAAKGIA